MILISYPHYTCGGLLCNIFNNEFNGFADHGGMEGDAHSLFKTRDDGLSQYTSIEELISSRLQTPSGVLPHAAGTHYPVLKMPLHMFDKVIHVTVTTTQSRMYRWIRAYYLYYTKSDDWTSLSGMDLVDKARETAKHYVDPIMPVAHEKVYNIEFADIVNCNANCYNNILKDNESWEHMMNLWKEKNYFLYSNDIWNSEPAQRYSEAEYELLARAPYQYV